MENSEREETDTEDALAAAGIDHELVPEGEADFEPDPERVAFLREIADEIREDSPESRQVAAFLYRVSDLYDENEDTTPVEIYHNVKHIILTKEQGGLGR